MPVIDRIFVNTAASDSHMAWRFRQAFPPASLIEVQHEAEMKNKVTRADKRSVCVALHGEKPRPLQALGPLADFRFLDAKNAARLTRGMGRR